MNIKCLFLFNIIKSEVMLENISNIGTVLNKTEQKNIKGGICQNTFLNGWGEVVEGQTRTNDTHHSI